MFKNLNPSALGVSGHQSEIIELALTYKFAGMDLDVADFATRARLCGMPYARRLIDSANIRLGTFELPFRCDADQESFEKGMEKLPEYARAAAEVGCTRCVTTLMPGGEERPYHENFEFHRSRLTEICAAIQPAGIHLGVGFQGAEYLRHDHAFQFVHDFDALTLLLKMADAPNLGLLLDVWDLVACGAPVDAIRNLPPDQIVAVQIADMPADVPLSELNQKSRLLPGAENSQIDTAGALIILADLGYDGPVTPKPSRGVFETRKRDIIVKQTGEAMDRVWRAAGLRTNHTAVAHAASAGSQRAV
jgi:sugar phosphate isomerase/epimerase